MKTTPLTAFLMVLMVSLGHTTHASSIEIKSTNAASLNNEQWQEVSSLWMVSFFNTYKDLPLDRIDSDIQGNSEDALIDWLKRRFAEYQEKTLQGSYEFTLVYKDKQLIGYTLHHLLPQSPIIHIDHLAVDPNCQGQGIGKLLLVTVANNHPEIESIVLTTRILNAPARSFYKHQGFYEVTENSGIVHFDPSYSVLLKKDIL